MIVASLLAGETPGATFLFNFAVAPKARGRGLAHKLLIGARARSPSRPFFYWTRHNGFFLGANQVYGYSVLD
jgi:ribosomal protein S18 acetylase RimI-like enzyme